MSDELQDIVISEDDRNGVDQDELEEPINDEVEPTLNTMALKLHDYLKESRHRTNGIATENFNENGTLLLLTATVQVLGRSSLSTWKGLAGNSASSAASCREVPGFATICTEMIKIKGAQPNFVNASFPSSWLNKVGKGINLWLQKGSKVSGSSKEGKKAFTTAAEGFQELFSGFILQLYNARTTFPTPQQIKDDVGDIIYEKGIAAAKRHTILKYKIILSPPGSKDFQNCVPDVSDDKFQRCRIEGYKEGKSMAINSNVRNNNTVECLEGLLPGDNLERQKILLVDKLNKKRDELDQLLEEKDLLKKEVADLEISIDKVERSIIMNNSNVRLVSKIREILPAEDNDLFDTVTEKVALLLMQIAQITENSQSNQTKKELFLAEMAKISNTFGAENSTTEIVMKSSGCLNTGVSNLNSNPGKVQNTEEISKSNQPLSIQEMLTRVDSDSD